MTTLDRINTAVKSGPLMPAAAENLTTFLSAKLPAWALASIDELTTKGAWSELNDRFYRYLEFGTGGMRGRTIGVVTAIIILLVSSSYSVNFLKRLFQRNEAAEAGLVSKPAEGTAK